MNWMKWQNTDEHIWAKFVLCYWNQKQVYNTGFNKILLIIYEKTCAIHYKNGAKHKVTERISFNYVCFCIRQHTLHVQASVKWIQMKLDFSNISNIQSIHSHHEQYNGKLYLWTHWNNHSNWYNIKYDRFVYNPANWFMLMNDRAWLMLSLSFIAKTLWTSMCLLFQFGNCQTKNEKKIGQTHGVDCATWRVCQRRMLYVTTLIQVNNHITMSVQ